jgi:hypothetical protein
MAGIGYHERHIAPIVARRASKTSGGTGDPPSAAPHVPLVFQLVMRKICKRSSIVGPRPCRELQVAGSKDLAKKAGYLQSHLGLGAEGIDLRYSIITHCMGWVGIGTSYNPRASLEFKSGALRPVPANPRSALEQNPLQLDDQGKLTQTGSPMVLRSFPQKCTVGQHTRSAWRPALVVVDKYPRSSARRVRGQILGDSNRQCPHMFGTKNCNWIC